MNWAVLNLLLSMLIVFNISRVSPPSSWRNLSPHKLSHNTFITGTKKNSSKSTTPFTFESNCNLMSPIRASTSLTVRSSNVVFSRIRSFSFRCVKWRCSRQYSPSVAATPSMTAINRYCYNTDTTVLYLVFFHAWGLLLVCYSVFRPSLHCSTLLWLPWVRLQRQVAGMAPGRTRLLDRKSKASEVPMWWVAQCMAKMASIQEEEFL